MELDFLGGLRTDLGMRRIGKGMSRLDEYWTTLGRLDPIHPDAPGILFYIAQWVDAGWRDVDVVQDGLGGFPKGRRACLRILDYIYVLMAEGMIWVGFSRIRPTRFRDNVSWVARGFKRTLPTRIALYDLTRRTCVMEHDLEPMGIGAVYSILPVTA